MKYLCVFALCAMSVDVYTQEPSAAVRPLDAWAGETIDRATEGSAAVRTLVALLQDANLVVHVETAAVMPMNLGGMTRLAATTGGYRYVRITLLRSLCPTDRATMLGHELQHAAEIAQSGATTLESVKQLFEQLDHRRRRTNVFETRAAIAMERRVALELRSPSVPRD